MIDAHELEKQTKNEQDDICKTIGECYRILSVCGYFISVTHTATIQMRTYHKSSKHW